MGDVHDTISETIIDRDSIIIIEDLIHNII